VTLPAENQQTVEALAERVRAEGVFMHSISETWDEGAQEYLIDMNEDGTHRCPPDCEGCASRARRDAALRDLVAQAELAHELGEALAESLQHPDHVSDEVRKERNHHALTLLTRLDASRSLDWWGDSGAFARLDGAR